MKAILVTITGCTKIIDIPQPCASHINIPVDGLAFTLTTKYPVFEEDPIWKERNENHN